MSGGGLGDSGVPGVAVGVVAEPDGEGGQGRGRGDLGGQAVAVGADGDDPGRIVRDGGGDQEFSSDPVPEASTTTRADALGGTWRASTTSASLVGRRCAPSRAR